MPKIELKQEVNVFSDEETKAKQEVFIDTEDVTENWVIVSHCGEELSMSCTNFDKLIDLYQEAKKQI